MKYLILVVLITGTVSVLAQQLAEDDSTSSKTNEELINDIKNRISQLKNLSPENYLNKVDEFRSGLDQFVEYRKKVCTGKFTTAVIGLYGDRGSVGPLSREEKALCFRELKNVQIEFINNLFIARKRFLGHIHTKKIEEMKLVKDEAIKRLNKNVSRKRKTKRKSQK